MTRIREFREQSFDSDLARGTDAGVNPYII